MTDPGVIIVVAPAADVIALDLWDDEDARGLWRDGALLQVEPRRWWMLDAGDRIAELAAAVGDRGAWAPIGGGLVRAALTGPGWRGLLMVAGLFDAEDPAFGRGAVVSTILHHVPVRIVVATQAACDVYFAASYAPTLIDLWSNTIGIQNISVASGRSAANPGTP